MTTQTEEYRQMLRQYLFRTTTFEERERVIPFIDSLSVADVYRLTTETHPGEVYGEFLRWTPPVKNPRAYEIKLPSFGLEELAKLRKRLKKDTRFVVSLYPDGDFKLEFEVFNGSKWIPEEVRNDLFLKPGVQPVKPSTTFMRPPADPITPDLAREYKKEAKAKAALAKAKKQVLQELVGSFTLVLQVTKPEVTEKYVLGSRCDSHIIGEYQVLVKEGTYNVYAWRKVGEKKFTFI